MLDIQNIPLDDKKTWDLIKSGRTGCVFQLESHLGKHWCKKIRPSNIEELSAVISLVRPGCLNSYSGDPPKNMAQRYADRKNGLEKVEPLHPSLSDILKNTQQILVYQESTMEIGAKLAGFDPITVQKFRKSFSKKDAKLMTEMGQLFVDGCEKIGIVNKEEAQEIFSWIEASNRYLFNRSHGIEYAINSYRTAYCKANYPLEFYCSYLLGCKWKQDSSESVKELVIDAREFGVEFGLPTLLDKKRVPYIKNNKIYFGLSLIRDIGDVAQERLLNAIEDAEKQHGPITTWSFLDTLIYLCDNVTNKVFEALIYSGSLDYFGFTRNRMFFEYEKLRELTKKELENLLSKHKENRYSSLGDALISLYMTKKENGICHSKKRSEFVFQLAESILNPNLNLNDSIRFLSALEKKYLGISISCMEYDGSVQADIANLTCKDIVSGHGNINIYLCAEVISIKEIKIKKEGNNFGKRMGILSIFDMTGSLDSIFVFPELYEEVLDNIEEGDSVFIMLDRSKKGGYICTSVEKI